MFIESSVSAFNGGAGIRSQGSAGVRIRISNVALTGNVGVSISVGTGEIRSFGNNHNSGNPGGEGAPTAGNLLLQ
jgi:hypothetical protein